MAIKVKVQVDKDHLREQVEEMLRETVFRYSEWLDREGLVREPEETDDPRTHEDLVSHFFDGVCK